MSKISTIGAVIGEFNHCGTARTTSSLQKEG